MYLPTKNLALARFHDQKTPIDSHPSYLPVIATSPDLICDWNLMGADSVQIQLRQLDCLVNSTDRQIPAVRPRITVVRCESNWMNKIAESSHPLRMQYWVGGGRYNARSSLERIFSSFDQGDRFEHHYIRGHSKMKALAVLAAAVMMAMALGLVRSGRQ